MGHQAVFAAALPEMIEAMGEAATYYPASLPAVPCHVFIEFDVLLQPAGLDSQVWEKGTTIEAALSVLGKVPERGETFVYGGSTYRVTGITKNDGLSAMAAVVLV
mgnify:CR=1 FL=1